MNMPSEQGQMQQSAGAGGGGAVPQQNPVVDAVKTIGVYIAGLQEKGDPVASQLQQIMAQFVQALRGSGAQQGEMEQGAPGGEEAMPMRQQGQAPGGGRGMNPMLGNMGGGARSMNRGQVAVI